MPAIKFDSSLNWSTVLSIVIAIVSVAGFFFGLKANQKVTAAQYADIKVELDDVKGQLGELRRLHLQVAQQSQQHEEAIKEVVKTAETNKEQITKNTKVIKVDLPKLFAAVENQKKDN